MYILKRGWQVKFNQTGILQLSFFLVTPNDFADMGIDGIKEAKKYNIQNIVSLLQQTMYIKEIKIKNKKQIKWQ